MSQSGYLGYFLEMGMVESCTNEICRSQGPSVCGIQTNFKLCGFSDFMQILQDFSLNFTQVLPNHALSQFLRNQTLRSLRLFCSKFWTIFGVPTVVTLPLLASVRPWIAMYVCSSYSGQKHVLSLHTIRDAAKSALSFGVKR